MPPASTQIMAGVLMLVASVIAAQPVSAQTTIRLYAGVAPGSESWSLPEQTITTLVPGVTGVANVSEPTLTVFRPNPGTANGTAVIVAPGGGLHFLTVDEDTKAAEWLAARGVTAFLLKYRVNQTTQAHRDTMFKESVKQQTAEQGAVFPLSVADARRAVSYVRERATEFGVDPNRVGMIGFSAGAMIALAAAVSSGEREGPDFIAPIYGTIMEYMRPLVVPPTAVPIFLAAASDDQLGFATASTEVYNAWLAQRRSAELHIYAKGGHGFGMRQQGLPVDSWSARFEDWLRFQGLLQLRSK
jgi:dienelactone hydrolase